MNDAPEKIWAVADPDDISAQILGDVYAQKEPDGMTGSPVEYVRADLARAKLEAAEAMHEFMCHLWCEMKLPPDMEDKMDMVFSAWDAAQKGGGQ